VRPEKISYGLIEAICADIARGFSYDRAAQNNGIAASTFFRWLREGHESGAEEIYKHFAREVKAASDFSEDEALQLIRSAATIDRNWKASAWFLEKRFPDKYGKGTKDKIQKDSEVNPNE
jgi:transposase